MTPELEDRLRAALQARAEQVTADKLTPLGLPAAKQRRTGRWLVPALVATAAAIAGLVAGSVTHPRLASGPVTPAVTPPAVTTTAAPTTTPPPHKPPASKPPATTHTTVAGFPVPSTAAHKADPPPRSFDGVRLRVPAGWRLTTVPDGAGQVGCLVSPAGVQPARAQDCALAIRVVDDAPDGTGIVDADVPGGLRDQAQTSCPGTEFTPGQRKTVTVDGRTGEYRTMLGACAQAGSVVQQWVFGDRPGVLLVRWGGGSRAEDATVAAVVAAAQLPAGTGQRLADFGHLVGYQQGAGGVTLTFDRVVPRGLWSADDVNDNPRTYDLPVADSVLVRSLGPLCGQPDAVPPDASGLGTATCPLAAVLQALTDNQATIAGKVLWVQYDADGTVGALVEEYRG